MQVNNGLDLIAEMPTKIANRPSESSENILHRTISVFSYFSEQKHEEQ
jgi:hypothetical protein